MFRKACLYVFALWCLSICPVLYAAGSEPQTMEHSGRLRGYLLHVPPQYKSVKTFPLVVVLHGGGGEAWSAEEMTGFSKLADEEDFIVVYPNGSGMHSKKLLTWNVGHCCGYAMDNDVDDAGFVLALIESLEKRYSIDAQRIFVTGISNGGMLAYRLACLYSDKIAAIAPVAGAMNDERCMPRSAVSVIAFHGTADRRVRYEGGEPEVQWDARVRKDKSVAYAMDLWARRNGCEGKPQRTENRKYAIDTWADGLKGAEVVLYTIKGGGHAWPGGKAVRYRADEPTTDVDATKVMWEFFKQHPKG
jgi:polyhydroxybutyrate depolymerase